MMLFASEMGAKWRETKIFLHGALILQEDRDIQPEELFGPSWENPPDVYVKPSMFVYLYTQTPHSSEFQKMILCIIDK